MRMDACSLAPVSESSLYAQESVLSIPFGILCLGIVGFSKEASDPHFDISHLPELIACAAALVLLSVCSCRAQDLHGVGRPALLAALSVSSHAVALLLVAALTYRSLALGTLACISTAA